MLIVGGNQSAGGYDVDNSLRFNDGSSDYLSRTGTTPTNEDKATISFWVKRGALGTYQRIISGQSDVSGRDSIYFLTDDKLYGYLANATAGGWNTSMVFRDTSAWYHIVISFDTTQATASNRVKVYVNGEEVSVTSTISITQNTNLGINNSSFNTIGTDSDGSPSEYFDGYMSEFCLIDGQQLDPTSFGEFDADSGIWKPIDVSGLTFGTNGFYLPFENSAALGQDDSGNGNNFTVNNLTSDDQMIDTPTNNFCTLNPLFRGGTVGETLEEGNLFYDSNYNKENFVCATQSVSTGKWYFEILPDATDTHGAYGFTNADNLLQTTALTTSPYDLGIGGAIRPDGNGSPNYKINTTSTPISVTTTSIFGIALDADTGYIEFFENNVSVGSGTITGITNYIPYANCHSQSAARKGIATFNFGQDSSFAGSKTRQNNTDNNGQGDFYYAPPSGYYALCTKNLAEYG